MTIQINPAVVVPTSLEIVGAPEGSIKPEETVELSVVYTPTDADVEKIIWTSSDPEVATVVSTSFNTAKVTALTNGSVIITASIAGYPEISAQCSITVYDQLTDILGIEADNNGKYVVYSQTGVMVLSTKDARKLNNLTNGIYIINGKKVFVRK